LFSLRSGMMISAIGSVICVAPAIIFARPISVTFGAESNIMEATVKHMPQYSWAFVVSSLNKMDVFQKILQFFGKIYSVDNH